MRSIRPLVFVRALMFAIVMAAIPAASFAQLRIGVSIRVGPPMLPVYEQPICPGDGYIWTPGYWAYGDDDYFWVPGTWVLAPEPGFLWTPGYWGWGGGLFLWHAGYWGPHVGFYGGVNYGFGYGGLGYEGGRWDHGVFLYNRAVNHVDVTIVHNTYNKTVVVNNMTVNRVSFNGGNGGVVARPSSEELAAEHEHHFGATTDQVQHEHFAGTNKSQFASVNHGNPGVAGTAKPGAFSGSGVVGTKGGGGTANSSFTGNGSNGTGNGGKHNDRPPSAGAGATASTGAGASTSGGSTSGGSNSSGSNGGGNKGAGSSSGTGGSANAGSGSSNSTNKGSGSGTGAGSGSGSSNKGAGAGSSGSNGKGAGSSGSSSSGSGSGKGKGDTKPPKTEDKKPPKTNNPKNTKIAQ